jgi:hypothetical protein
MTKISTFPVRQAIALAALLLLGGAWQLVHAQPAAAAEAAASAPAPAASTPASAPVAKYSAADLDRAFNFMDGNHDGKVTRDEASNFRGVSRHFDQADTNKDGFLSREEFESAMNKAK